MANERYRAKTTNRQITTLVHLKKNLGRFDMLHATAALENLIADHKKLKNENLRLHNKMNGKPTGFVPREVRRINDIPPHGV